MTTTTVFITAFFGAAGVLVRYAVERAFTFSLTPSYLLSTLSINVIGSFALGVVYFLGNERSVLSPEMTLAISVGFLGGFTTFSAFSLQMMQLFEQKQVLLGMTYAVGAPALGVLAAFAGASLARTLGANL